MMMPTDEQRARSRVHESFLVVSNSLRSAVTNLPGLLREARDTECWKERLVEQTKKMATFPDFRTWLESPRPEGLESDADLIRRVLQYNPMALSELELLLGNMTTFDRSNQEVKRLLSLSHTRIEVLEQLFGKGENPPLAELIQRVLSWVVSHRQNIANQMQVEAKQAD